MSDTIFITIVIIMLVIYTIIIIYPSIIHETKIKEICGYIFNPATTLSNYTSYKHCLEYPEMYGVDK